MGVFDWIGVLANTVGKGASQAADAVPGFLGGRGDTGFGLGGGSSSSTDSYTGPTARPFPTTAQSRGDTYESPPKHEAISRVHEIDRSYEPESYKAHRALRNGPDVYPAVSHYEWDAKRASEAAAKERAKVQEEIELRRRFPRKA
jgi:hypothetical protein